MLKMTEEENQEIEKVRDRVSSWFKNPQQINTRILLAYLSLSQKRNNITKELLEVECRRCGVTTFQINYPQMKSIAEKNHAKVFDENGGFITLWEPVSKFILREYEKFLAKSDDEIGLFTKINNKEEPLLSFEDISDLWLKYNDYANRLSKALGRTSNIVGEYAEYLTLNVYGGKLLRASASSADIQTLDGKLIQVKARKVKGDKLSGVGLGIIRSWEFDTLLIVLFKNEGQLKQVLEVPVDVAKEYAVKNSHQHGWVITTNRTFLDDFRIKNMTEAFWRLSNEG